MPSEFRKHVLPDEPKPTKVIGFAQSPSVSELLDALEDFEKNGPSEETLKAIAASTPNYPKLPVKRLPVRERHQ